MSRRHATDDAASTPSENSRSFRHIDAQGSQLETGKVRRLGAMEDSAAAETGHVLIVDDDADVARFIEMNLTFEGFEVTVARQAHQAIDDVAIHRPDLILLDVMMPHMDGVEFCRRLRANPMTTGIAVIMLTAKALSVDKVVGLTAGADDYIIKPFDTLELVARVRSTLRRNREMRDVSPLTGLPGNNRIMAEIEHRVADKLAHDDDYAVCYLDLDNFKAVNDAYGFLRGDQLIALLAETLLGAAIALDGPTPFVGHVGGDDFVLVCHPDQVEQCASAVIAEFEHKSPMLYDEEDRERAYLEVLDRQGVARTYALPTISVGVVTSVRRRFSDYREVVAIASEMKQLAKRTPGSVVAADRRGEETSRTGPWTRHHEEAAVVLSAESAREAGRHAVES